MLKRSFLKKLFSLTVAVCTISQMTAHAIPYDEYMSGRYEYTDATYKISPGLTYTEKLSENAKYGYERSYVFEYTPNMGTEIVPAVGSYVYGTSSLGTITKNLEKDGVRVVGGVNGDFYSTTTGVPIGGMIVDGEIYSSDNDRTALGFKKDGTAFISKPGIKATLSDGENEINLEHINKYPLEYSLYLLTDKFYTTTKTTLASTEIILLPYTEVEVFETEDEYNEYIASLETNINVQDKNEDNKKDENAEQECDKKDDVTEAKEEKENDKDELTEENTQETEEVEETEESEEAEETMPEEPEYFFVFFADESEESESSLDDENEEPSSEIISAEQKEDETSDASEIDEEQKEAEEAEESEESEESETAENTENDEKAENTQESEASEDTENTDDAQESETSEETVKTDDAEKDGISEDSEDLEEPDTAPEYFAKRYTVSGEKLTIGCNIKVAAVEIREDSINSEIPEGCFVICAENANQMPKVSHIKKGDEFTISVSANEEWYDVVHAIGNTGGLILKDGEYCDDVEIDHYPYAHPRTAVGITADGRVIFYCVDGRQTSSGGLRIDQLSHEMKELGCVIAMNLDGGGSTTAYAALPGESFSTLKNSPSGNVERRTANSLVFINTTERQNKPTRFTFYPERPYVVAGGSSYTLPKPKATDANYHPVDLPHDFKYNYYTSPIQTDSYVTEDGVFVSGERSGAVKVYIHVEMGGETLEYMAGTVFVLSQVTDFAFDTKELTLEPFETAQLSFEAKYHTAPLFYDKGSLRFSLPEVIKNETESENVESENASDREAPKDTDEISQTETEPTEREYFKITSDNLLENEKGSVDHELVFAAKTHSETLLLSAKLGDFVSEIIINITEYPFTDSFSHWSAKNLYEIYKLNLMQGEMAEDGLAFAPTRNMTKSEFITVLARMLYPDIDAKIPEEIEVIEETEVTEETETVEETEVIEEAEQIITYPFSDFADIPEWARKYYDAMLSTGLLELLVKSDENGNNMIYPSENITRYDVLVMLGALSDEVEKDLLSEYADAYIFDASPHKNFINSAVGAKIFEGYEDKTLRPQNLLTRAEAATVILRFFNNQFAAQTE